jgi:hypothetical protein
MGVWDPLRVNNIVRFWPAVWFVQHSRQAMPRTALVHNWSRKNIDVQLVNLAADGVTKASLAQARSPVPADGTDGEAANDWSSTLLGTIRNWASVLDGKRAQAEPIRFEIRNDRPSETPTFAKKVKQTYGVYRHLHFQHVHECLYPGLEHS